MDKRLIYVCEICGAVLDEHHCKAQCPNCGRMFDCSDLPIMAANASIDDEEGEIVARPGSDLSELLRYSRGAAQPPAPAKPPPPKPDGKGAVADLP